jgi:hypothetical protein
VSVDALIRSAMDAGVELRMVDGKIKLIGKHEAVTRMIEPLRRYKNDVLRWMNRPTNDPEQPKSEWQPLATAYHQHHFNCRTCCAAGQGRGLRCGAGAALWRSYGGDAYTKPIKPNLESHQMNIITSHIEAALNSETQLSFKDPASTVLIRQIAALTPREIYQIGAATLQLVLARQLASAHAEREIQILRDKSKPMC